MKCIKCKPKSEGGERYPGCQDHCEHGIKLREELKNKNRKIAEAKRAEKLIIDTKMESIFGEHRRGRK